jgi:hypothetical protein
MKLLVTGVCGRLGRAIAAEVAAQGHTVKGHQIATYSVRLRGGQKSGAAPARSFARAVRCRTRRPSRCLDGRLARGCVQHRPQDAADQPRHHRRENKPRRGRGKVFPRRGRSPESERLQTDLGRVLAGDEHPQGEADFGLGTPVHVRDMAGRARVEEKIGYSRRFPSLLCRQVLDNARSGLRFECRSCLAKGQRLWIDNAGSGAGCKCTLFADR